MGGVKLSTLALESLEVALVADTEVWAKSTQYLWCLGGM
jgi:hypothetical protein